MRARMEIADRRRTEIAEKKGHLGDCGREPQEKDGSPEPCRGSRVNALNPTPYIIRDATMQAEKRKMDPQLKLWATVAAAVLVTWGLGTRARVETDQATEAARWGIRTAHNVVQMQREFGETDLCPDFETARNNDMVGPLSEGVEYAADEVAGLGDDDLTRVYQAAYEETCEALSQEAGS